MAKKSFFSEEDMARLRAITMEELQELDERLEVALGKLDGDPGDAAALKDILLVFHTVGGSAGLAGLPVISKLGIDTESRLRNVSPPAPPDILDMVRQARARLHELMAAPA